VIPDSSRGHSRWILSGLGVPIIPIPRTRWARMAGRPERGGLRGCGMWARMFRFPDSRR